ncbi:MAG: lipocalin family protein [Saprospiraceae bacterium]
MNPSGQIILLLAVMVWLQACSKNEKTNMIIGRWKGSEWLVEGSPSSHAPEQAIFTFSEDGTYSFEYAGDMEHGTYYVNNSQLFTTPDGGIKIMVKIPKLTRDTLIFDMNSGGQGEKLTLIRN